MHNRFDRLVKRLIRKAWSPGGHVETEAEVSPDTQRIDVWFWPAAERVRKVMAPLGLLGRMGGTSCTLEPSHCTPSGGQVTGYIAKHWFFRRELARRKPRPPAPTQWIISSGRPSAALAGLRFRRSRMGAGIYEAPPLLGTRIVVVSELPQTRDTLLVRLMGAGRTLRRAVADVRALPHDAFERRLALPILVRLRLEIPADPAKQTKADREFLMTAREIDRYLEQLRKEGLQEGRKEGRKEGIDEGFAQAVLAAYRARFGAAPAALVAAVKRASDQAALQRWLEIVTTRSAEEVAAELRRPRTTRSGRRTMNRRSGVVQPSPLRLSAAR